MQALDALREAESTYTPNQEVLARTREKTVIALVGPFAVGKTTLMERVKLVDPAFGVAGTFTTRDEELRDAGSRYRFLPHNEVTIEEVLRKVENGELVQYAVHPTTNRIYGSELHDYPTAYTLVDLLSSAVAPMARLPFNDFKVAGIVCPPEQWLKRLEDRRSSSTPEEMQKRLKEAQTSLKWLLEQANVSWVNNTDGEEGLERAVLDIIDYSKDDAKTTTVHRDIGSLMLAQTEELMIPTSF